MRSIASSVTLTELEHVLRAAGAVTQQSDLVVIGSQAILPSLFQPIPELMRSAELDLYPLHRPELADLIDGSIGEKSMFHETFGYYGHGVGPETAVLPPDWQSRLVLVENFNTGGVRGLCLAPTDLAVSKVAAGRPKDREFVQVLLRHRLVDPGDLLEKLMTLQQPHLLERFQAWSADAT